MSSNGGNLQRLTFKLAPETSPAWSPNGRLIAFRRVHTMQDFGDLCDERGWGPISGM